MWEFQRSELTGVRTQQHGKVLPCFWQTRHCQTCLRVEFNKTLSWYYWCVIWNRVFIKWKLPRSVIHVQYTQKYCKLSSFAFKQNHWACIFVSIDLQNINICYLYVVFLYWYWPTGIFHFTVITLLLYCNIVESIWRRSCWLEIFGWQQTLE